MNLVYKPAFVLQSMKLAADEKETSTAVLYGLPLRLDSFMLALDSLGH